MTTILHGRRPAAGCRPLSSPQSPQRECCHSLAHGWPSSACADAESSARVVITMDSTPLGEAVVTLMGTDFFARTGPTEGSHCGIHPGLLLMEVKHIGTRLSFPGSISAPEKR